MSVRFRPKSGLNFNPKVCTASSARSGEEGYILLAVLFMVVMVLITLSVAAPKVAADIQRDREIELQHRGLQYRRAIQLYYRKFNAYPPNMEALVKTNEIRFLRRRYVDPATGKDEWHLIHFGENKTPAAMGFFGQAIAGSTLAGIGPGGVGQAAGTSAIGSSAFGNNASGNGAFGSSGFGNSGFGNSTPPVSDPNAGNAAGGAAAPTTGAAGTDPNSAANSSTGSTTSSTSAFGGNGQTFGGGGIIGVESTSPKATILEYKKKKHFNEWEFVYDPASERQTVSNNLGTVGQPGGPGNSTTPFGNSPGISNQPPPGAAGPPPNGGAPDPNQNQPPSAPQ